MLLLPLLLLLSCSVLVQPTVAFQPLPLSTTTQRATSIVGPLQLGDFFNFNKNDQEAKEETTDKATTTEEKDDDSFQDAAYDPEDPIEQVFSFFFGKREEKPMGMGECAVHESEL